MARTVRSFSLCEPIIVPPGMGQEDHGNDGKFNIRRGVDGIYIQRKTKDPCNEWGHAWPGNIRGTVEVDEPDQVAEEEPEPKRAGVRR